MDKEAFELLISNKPASVRMKGVTLYNAYTKTLSSYQAESTTARLKDWQSAEAALSEFVHSLKEESESFSSTAEVLAYLRDAGWKVTKTSLYRHLDQGKFAARDGLFRRGDIDRYARTWLKQKATGKRVNEATEELQRKKLEKELERLDIDIKQRRQDYDRDAGRLIPREQMEVELAGRAAILDAGLKHWINTNAMEWIRLADGDVKKVGELIFALTRSIDEHLNAYAQPQDFKIVIEDEEEPELHPQEETVS